MRTEKYALLVIGLLCTAASVAQSPKSGYGTGQIVPGTCPWLTAGTAANALGGDVTANLAITSLAEGTCRFARSSDPKMHLEIQVSAAPIPHCPAESVVLRGIGNEALQCRVAAAHGATEEMVSGRVRDLHFAVVMADHADKRIAKSPEGGEDEVVRIADEVAGNLF
jgi:hypothetical protein